MNGYGHSGYAASLAEFGSVQPLSACGGWILKRRIQGASSCDAIGCYPLFACEDWRNMPDDLHALQGKLVSVTLVADPFGNYDETLLRACFTDMLIPFKQHYVIDMDRPLYSWVSEHHRRYARKALKTVTVERCEHPLLLLDEWITLYHNLIERHGIRGMAAFSRNSFAQQLRVPGMVAFRASVQEKTAGMLLWFVQGNRAYYHLGAYDSRGYEHHASFALFWIALEYFAGIGMRWIHLGANPGMSDNQQNGLARFKQGWSTGTRTAYLCGRICNPVQYRELAAARQPAESGYFPAYRAGEYV
jgi:hypothetical protein